MRERYDAIVMGGGPAGALSAIKLAQAGWRTALLERGERNRNKACGHCVSARGMAILERHGLGGAVRGIAQGQTRVLRVHGRVDRTLESPLGQMNQAQSGGVIAPRHRMDQLLVDAAAAAGAQIFQPAAARLRDRAEDECVVEVVMGDERVEMRSGLVVVASGLGSSVTRIAGRDQQGRVGRKYGFAFDCSARGEWTSGARSAIRQQAIEMFVVDGGYIGVVRMDDGDLHIAGLVGAGNAANRRDPMEFCRGAADMHEPLRQIGLDGVCAETVTQFSAIGPMAWRPHARSIASDRIVLVGDAAGYVEPFTGEGIAWALAGAEIVGEIAMNLRPGAWDDAAARHYRREWKRRIARRQVVCRAVAFALERSWLTQAMLTAGRRFPTIVNRLVQQAVSA